MGHIITQRDIMGAPKGHEPYNKNGEGGRPLKYTDEFIEKEAEAFEEWITRKDSLWFEEFAHQRGYLGENLSLFANSNKRFSVAYKKAKEWQKYLLIKGGLLKKFNSNTTALLLSHNYGIHSKSESVISGDAANPFSALVHVVQGETKELVNDKEE